MIDRNRYESLADALASVDDLEEVKAALIREATIREVMRETGEDRRTVTDMMDAMASMGQEAVLELTEGEPTTLADALQRYVDQLPEAVKTMTGEVSENIVADLSALLAYPWPGQTAQDGPAAGACPTCQATGGFHEDGPHRAERDRIPAHLKRPSNTAARREQRAAGGPLRS
jgi:hypothetical protein